MDMRKKGNETTNKRRKYSRYERKGRVMNWKAKTKTKRNWENKEINMLEKAKTGGQKQ